MPAPGVTSVPRAFGMVTTEKGASMAVTEQGTGTGTGSGSESEQLRRAFEEGPTAFELLRGIRTRRVGLGYRMDSGTTEKHPVTGREMSQMEGPMKFVSQKQPV